MKRISKTDIFCLMAIVMLVLIITTGFFSVPIGINICSILCIIYGYKYKEKSFIKWGAAALAIGLASVVYTIVLIGSM